MQDVNMKIASRFRPFRTSSVRARGLDMGRLGIALSWPGSQHRAAVLVARITGKATAVADPKGVARLAQLGSRLAQSVRERSSASTAAQDGRTPRGAHRRTRAVIPARLRKRHTYDAAGARRKPRVAQTRRRRFGQTARSAKQLTTRVTNWKAQSRRRRDRRAAQTAHCRLRTNRARRQTANGAARQRQKRNVRRPPQTERGANGALPLADRPRAAPTIIGSPCVLISRAVPVSATNHHRRICRCARSSERRAAQTWRAAQTTAAADGANGAKGRLTACRRSARGADNYRLSLCFCH